jgi:hypothetical protein
MKDEIRAIFERYVPNVSPDIKLMNYWSNAIAKGDKTVADLTFFLLKNKEYMTSVKARFTDMYYDYIGNADKSNHEMFDEMMAYFGDRLITDEDMWDFVSNSSSFYRQYTDIIIKVFKSCYDRLPYDEEIRTYMGKFQKDREYSIECMKQEVLAQNAAKIQSRGGGAIVKVLGKDEEPRTSAAPSLLDDIVYVEQYESMFKRNMNVREYLMHIKDLRARKNTDDLLIYIQDLYQTQSLHYQNIKEILHVFLNEYISEEDFLSKYLVRINEYNFIDNLRKEILASQAYEDKMKEKIQSIYEKMFGDKMTIEDTDFLFNQVRILGLELMHEQINQLVIQFKDDNEETMQRIFDIYMEVYDREPDVNEQNRFIAFIRDHKGRNNNDVDDMIVLELKDALEYHDVLKRKISKIYTSIKKDTIFPSMVYRVLNKVLPMKNIKNIDDYIERAILDL